MCWNILLSLALLGAQPHADKYFKITVVDDQTGRGVPLVELRTTNNLRYYTDSNGIVAFYEPGLMNQSVFFSVQSHGYEFPNDSFGFRGKALNVTEGGSATLKINRLNIAERLYRITGAGIYADTILVGEKPPIRRPLLNAQVMGSDSVLNAFYNGKIYWFWGDTNRPRYPLGNFQTPGATSAVMGKGGLDPDVGIDLDYFTASDGFAKEMAPVPGEGPTWLTGLTAVPDEKFRMHLVASYMKVKPPMTIYERGLVEFDDDRQQFAKVATIPLDSPVFPQGHPFLHTADGVNYIYFASPYPLVRVCAVLPHWRDLKEYEAFTCLKEGTKLEQGELDRVDGQLRYAWKKNTPPVGPAEQAKWLKSRKIKEDDCLLQLRDAETGKLVQAHAGSVYWNPYRRRWVMITVQTWGTSLLGEVWYAEADTPLGPWVYARKIVTHDKYSFYNPKQHPFFSKDNGRVIYFEGTYSESFSGAPQPTPRYDYNQMMYKLDLADPRLILPVAVYRMGKGEPDNLAVGKPGNPIAFFALDRPATGTLPVFVVEEGKLHVGANKELKDAKPLFYALPADAEKPLATTIPLYEFVSTDGKRRIYSTDPKWSAPEFRRQEKPLCRVWQNPLRVVIPVEH